ncbi:MAG TPA: hypothetical protein VGD80_25965 [Kofleriaceae bacterium]
MLSVSLACPLVLAACGGNGDADPFDTLQDCYDDHHNVESLSVHDSIVVCCLDHPIAGVHPSCLTTQADCVSHVDAELDATVSLSDIQAACTDYVKEL